MRLRIVVSLAFLGVMLCSLSSFRSESELSKLMRTMVADMKKLRVKVQQNEKIPHFYKRYSRIYTAKPSADSKKGERFDEYAKVFLTQCERFAQAAPEQQKAEYNNLVKTCIHCHESYCPGPLTMLKKMQL